MAIDNHGGDIQHSIYGRQFGLDMRKLGVFGSPSQTANGFGGDLRYGTETIASTVPSTLAPAGTSLLQATASAVYELVTPQASMIGVRKRIFHNSTGAAAQLVKLTSGNFVSVYGSSQNTLSLSTRGAYVDLEYISSSLVAVNLQTSSTTLNLVTATTTT